MKVSMTLECFALPCAVHNELHKVAGLIYGSRTMMLESVRVLLVLQVESRASLRASVRPKGLGVGGARKRLRLVEHESKRLQQV